jgi:hypothetical protein
MLDDPANLDIENNDLNGGKRENKQNFFLFYMRGLLPLLSYPLENKCTALSGDSS